jgi:hypothetical protein
LCFDGKLVENFGPNIEVENSSRVIHMMVGFIVFVVANSHW